MSSAKRKWDVKVKLLEGYFKNFKNYSKRFRASERNFPTELFRDIQIRSSLRPHLIKAASNTVVMIVCIYAKKLLIVAFEQVFSSWDCASIGTSLS